MDFVQFLMWGCDKSDAITRIRDGEPHIKTRRAQQAAFAEADQKVAAAVPGASKGQRRALAVEATKDAMGPLAPFYPHQDALAGAEGGPDWPPFGPA